MESGYIEIELNGETRRYPISQTFILSAMDNQDLIYNVHAYVKDAGHETRDEVRVRIDRKAPVSNLYIDNEPVQNRMEIKNSKYKLCIGYWVIWMHQCGLNTI